MTVSASRFLATCAAAALLAVALSACGGGSGGGSSTVVVDPMPEPMPDPDPMPEPEAMPEPPEMETDDVTQPPIMVDYSQPSHDLQASVARTNWRTFHNDAGSGIAYGDFDGDGDEDVFIAPGTVARVEPANNGVEEQYWYYFDHTPVEIWENDGNGNFSKATNKFFADTVPAPLGVRKATIGDYNNDGRPDIFVVTTGHDAPPFAGEQILLLLSSEDGFREETGLDQIIGFHHGAASADIDQDGDLDIFVTDTTNDPYFLINDATASFNRIQTLSRPRSMMNM